MASLEGMRPFLQANAAGFDRDLPKLLILKDNCSRLATPDGRGESRR
jgi:hypothetical protein